MSSMLRTSMLSLLLATACVSTPAHCADGRAWDVARQQNLQTRDAAMYEAIQRWERLVASRNERFGEYAGFLLTYPGFPREVSLRTNAEQALERESIEARTLISYFQKFPPITNPARARYAMALASLNAPGARDAAIAAWRGGSMSETAEAALRYQYGNLFTRDDHDARMNALLWDGATRAAERQISYVSPQSRDLFMRRLNLQQGSAPGSLGLPTRGEMLRDPGYVYERVRQARQSGGLSSAIALLATRPELSHPVHDPEKWVKELLTAARGASAENAVRIAASIDDAFAPGTDISQGTYRLRDDYTSLMWLGGTQALWTLGDAKRAAPLFYRYGAAAQTPGTRSKGFYWAGRALAQAGDRSGAERYLKMAAEYPNHFYGLLALERLDRPIPTLNLMPAAQPSQAEREAFRARPLTRAVREVARDFDWRTSIQFFRAISEQAESETDHILVAELARDIGRRDLAVILGREAHTGGFDNFHHISYPLIPTPPGVNWTMVHAITRQESQFAQNAISHAGARGLMQLMPGTAREQAGKMGLSYSLSSLITDPAYNIRLGNGYFARMMDYYNGSYPLAAAAYNAGPGNVNRWLRSNGDPRQGGVDWVTWIERIPFFETKNYVQNVLENAVVYEAMNPERGYDKGKYPLSRFLGKRTPD